MLSISPRNQNTSSASFSDPVVSRRVSFGNVSFVSYCRLRPAQLTRSLWVETIGTIRLVFITIAASTEIVVYHAV